MSKVIAGKFGVFLFSVVWLVGTLLVFPWKEPIPRVFPIDLPEGAQELVLKEVDKESFLNLEFSPVYFYTTHESIRVFVDYYGVSDGILYHATETHGWYDAYKTTSSAFQGRNLAAGVARDWWWFLCFALGMLIFSAVITAGLYYLFVLWDGIREKLRT